MDYLKNSEAREVLTERSICAEGVVGEAKVLHGLRRATCRGLEKVTIQALLTAVVQNIKRLVRSKVPSVKEKPGLAYQSIVRLSSFSIFNLSSATAPFGTLPFILLQIYS